MSQERRSARGWDVYLDYWHRSAALRRFLGNTRAGLVSLIDIDCCEFCHLCSEPVALIETKDIRARTKVGTVTARLASRAMLEAYLVEYEVNEAGDDITEFIVTAWHPVGSGPRSFSPQQYADWLWELRSAHWRSECTNPASKQMLAWPTREAS